MTSWFTPFLPGLPEWMRFQRRDLGTGGNTGQRWFGLGAQIDITPRLQALIEGPLKQVANTLEILSNWVAAHGTDLSGQLGRLGQRIASLESKFPEDEWNTVISQTESILKGLRTVDSTQTPTLMGTYIPEVRQFVATLLSLEGVANRPIDLTSDQEQHLQSLLEAINQITTTDDGQGLTLPINREASVEGDNEDEIFFDAISELLPDYPRILQGIATLKNLKFIDLPLLMVVQNGVRAKPHQAYLNLKKSLLFLQKKLRGDRGFILEGSTDIQRLESLKDQLDAVLAIPHLRDTNNVISRLRQALFVAGQDDKPIWDIERDERDPQATIIKCRLSADLHTQDIDQELAEALSFVQSRIEVGSGLLYHATQELRTHGQRALDEIRETLNVPTNERLACLRAALVILKRKVDYLTDKECDIIHQAIEQATHFLGRGQLSEIKLTHDEKNLDFQADFTKVINALRRTRLVQPGWFSGGRAVLPQDARDLVTRRALATIIEQVISLNGEGILVSIERHSIEGADELAHRISDQLPSKWQILGSIALICVGYFVFDFTRYVLRRRVYDIALSMMPLKPY